jgi:hypothetical protein
LKTLPIIPLTLCLLLTLSHPAQATDADGLSGRAIMEEVYRRHEQFPYIYEEQVMVLIDVAGNRDTRKLRRFSRLDSEESGRYLLLFDDPPEVRGVGLLTTIEPPAQILANIYLPAYGPQLIESVGQNQADTFLGTDFSVNDLLPEPLDRYRFVRQQDESIGELDYFVLDVFRQQAGTNETPVKRHYIRQDNYYITRTDSFDRHGRLHKQLTHHDLKSLGGSMWRANMILMKDLKSKHQSLIKISRRVFSRDYVPNELFTLEWLINNQHLPVEEADPPSADKDRDNPTGLNVSQMMEIAE